MMVSKQGEDCKVCVDGKEIEQVQNMKYLGAILSADGTSEEEVEHRVPNTCLLYTSPSPRDRQKSRMPSSA